MDSQITNKIENKVTAPSSVIYLTGKEKAHYLDSLADSLRIGSVELEKEYKISPTSSNYYKALADLLTVASLGDEVIENSSKITISNISGMPMLSQIIDIKIDQDTAKNEKDERSEKEIVEDIIDSLYNNNFPKMYLFLKEFSKGYYFNRLRNSQQFEKKVEDIVIEGKNVHEYNWRKFTYHDYPMSEMAPIIFIADYFITKKKLNKKEMEDMVYQDIQLSYDMLTSKKHTKKNTYLIDVRKFKPTFMFNGKTNMDPYLIKLIGKNPENTLLEITVDTIEPFDTLLAESKADLKNVDFEDYSKHHDNLYICSERIKEDLNYYLREKGIMGKVISKD